MANPDEGLRRAALQTLGPLGPSLARDALESGVLEVEREVLAWTGSTGTVHGHRVVLRVDAALCDEVNASPSAIDALTAAVAAAISMASGNALAELAVLAHVGRSPTATPYRGRT